MPGIKNIASSFKISLLYIFTISGSLLGFFYIRSLGESKFNFVPPEVSEAVAKVSSHGDVFHVLLALVAIIIVSRACGFIFSLLYQPAVVGEVIGGILLGPSLLGKYFPEVAQFLIPKSSLPLIGIIAQIGVILYMFIVGLELDLKTLKKSGHATMAISHASIVFPFMLGTALALFIYESLAPKDVAFTSFSLFLGVSLSITAFPVLARILSDRSLQKTKIGGLALACAAIDDVTAWCLLAFVVSISQAKLSSAFITVGVTFLYIVVMFVFFRPLLGRLIAYIDKKELTEGNMALIFVGMLGSALITELIGIHAIFGAFLFGALIHHESSLAKDIQHRLENMIKILFLPAFFAFTGMRTEIGLLNSFDDWTVCLTIIGIATAGKFLGTYVMALCVGIENRVSMALGVLMNTRGLVELIVLNIGLDLGIISPKLFAMLVIMALATTFMTGPMLSLLFGKKMFERLS